MKNLLLLLLLTITTTSFAGDFLSFSWNFTPSQVNKNSKIKFTKYGSTMQAKSKLGGKPCVVFLNFHQNKFYAAMYQFNFDTGTPSNEYVSFYKKMRDLLIKKYGKPKVVGDDEFSIYEKDDYYNYKRASEQEKYKRKVEYGIILGDVTISTFWSLPRTYVKILLFSIKTGKYSRQAIIQITYQTQNKKLLEAVATKAEQKDLTEL